MAVTDHRVWTAKLWPTDKPPGLVFKRNDGKPTRHRIEYWVSTTHVRSDGGPTLMTRVNSGPWTFPSWEEAAVILAFFLMIEPEMKMREFFRLVEACMIGIGTGAFHERARAFREWLGDPEEWDDPDEEPIL